MVTQANINFHQTFKPEAYYISSILRIADGTKGYSVSDISSLTGIPNGISSGKVEPHIYYANYMGLIDFMRQNGEYILSRTELGKVVYEEDPGLHEELTKILCHAMLCRNCKGADVWSVSFNQIFPKYKTGIEKDVFYKLIENIIGSKANSKNIAPFFGSYLDMFASLLLLDSTDDKIFVKPLSYNQEYIYLYAYILFDLWDNQFPNEDEISSMQLKELCFGSLFGWSDEYEYKILEHLSDANLIRLNRQLMPYTILKLVSKNVLLNKLYSELC